MALPETLRDAAMRLTALAARHAGIPRSALPLDAEEAGQLTEVLFVVAWAFIEEDDSSVVDALLSDDRLLLALLRLVAFAVRGLKQNDLAFRDVAEGALHATVSLLRLKTPTAWRARVLLGFGRKLLRMDTLQCCSSAFAEGAAALEAIAAGGAAGAEARPAEAGLVAAAADGAAGAAAQAPQGQPAVVEFELNTFCVLVRSLLGMPAGSVGALGAQCSARQRQKLGEQRQLFVRELAAALRDSRVLEHCARWALRAQLAGAAGQVLEGLAGSAVRTSANTLAQADAMATQIQGQSAAPALREALSGPSVRHLVLSLGLAALCAADGGSSHGLPDELLLHLPILGVAGEDLRGMHGRQRLECSTFRCVLWALEDVTVASATPPRDWRSVVALLHRLGSLLLASARAWADEAAVVEAGPQPPALQLVLDTTSITAIAVPLLEQYRRLVGGHQAAAAGVPELAEAAWWRLAVDLAMRCVRWANASEVAALADLLGLEWVPVPTDGVLAAERPPAAAPRVVVAALTSGWLPLWERLLRCAGREPLSPEASLLTRMLGEAGNRAGVCHMLACCDPRQGAALVATWGKLLRTLAVPQLLSGVDEGADTPRTALACALISGAVAVLIAAVRPLAAGWHQYPGEAAAEAMPPQLQLARLLSFALCEWLPPLARLARERVLAMRDGQLDRQAMHVKTISASTDAASGILRWLPALARCSDAELGRAAEEAVLLREIGAVALLGKMLMHLPVAGGSADQLILVDICCCVAVACPGEVRQAVLAATAEAAAAASSGGWSPQRLRVLADLCTGEAAGGAALDAADGAALAAAASALASQAELWAAGGGEDGGELVRALAARAPGSVFNAQARALTSSPEARALLRTCANPVCDNLAGDSEAELLLRACGRCGGAWYCRKECLAAHWRVGHREACTGRGVTAAGAAGPRESAAASSAL
ncbi:hypothetical protein TSOC_004278 [Tetrabaena socialis]|uniref:MYND-type domain-containing protein n=1 Tax=Tetrabaena socialis TaxID=47790 RepID=A0A2J8A9B2_9CHLO|nr:hypothetical protein TSOC_004278 [Tetrabaena socialis]|eukprot:PNH09109.1 hypothetical protein TSOC_004278 [Tetrabaena socialis]